MPCATRWFQRISDARVRRPQQLSQMGLARNHSLLGKETIGINVQQYILKPCLALPMGSKGMPLARKEPKQMKANNWQCDPLFPDYQEGPFLTYTCEAICLNQDIEVMGCCWTIFKQIEWTILILGACRCIYTVIKTSYSHVYIRP